jgi:trk system potassium uptake protein TrkH
MNARAVASLLGGLCLLFAAAQLVPAAVSFGTGEARTAQAFLVSALIAAVLAGLLRSVGRGSMHGPDGRPAFFRREGLATVGLGWIVASALGALPFVLAGAAAPVDAFFESTSGFTTTGATIFSASAVDGLAKGLSFWRGFSHWIGGIGIVLSSSRSTPRAGGTCSEPRRRARSITRACATAPACWSACTRSSQPCTRCSCASRG